MVGSAFWRRGRGLGETGAAGQVKESLQRLRPYHETMASPLAAKKKEDTEGTPEQSFTPSPAPHGAPRSKGCKMPACCEPTRMCPGHSGSKPKALACENGPHLK